MASRPAIASHSGMLARLPVLVEILSYRNLDPMHWHDYTQIWYVLRGSLRHNINGKEYIQLPGQCAAILPYTPHSIDARESANDVYILALSYSDKFLADHGHSIFSYSKEYARFDGFKIPEYVTFEGELRERADAYALAMIDEFSKHKQMSFDKLAEYLAAFLKILCTQPAESVKGLNVIIERTSAITETIQYMADNLSQKLPLDSLCSRACMSRCAFTRNFKAVTGITSKEFLLSARLLRASLLLVFSDKTVSEISKETGFYDSAYLVRAFRNKFGKSPKQYRENCRSAALANDAVFRARWAWVLDSDEECGRGSRLNSHR